MDLGKKYQCVVCKIPAFKSRSDWLVHLVLSPHSLKVRQHFQHWQTARNKDGEFYVVSELANVENSMLLEYVADGLRSFADIVFFKPQANICMIVCDPRELNAFNGRRHNIGGTKLTFKPFAEIDSAEWTSYFRDACIDLESKTKSQASIPTTTASVPTKRKLEDTNGCAITSIKSAKLTHQSSPSSSANAHTHNRATASSSGIYGLPTTNNPKQGTDWEGEMEKLLECIFMPNTKIESRKNVIAHLTDIFKPVYPNCNIIPVGADMLAFNIEDDFTLFFDSKGITRSGHESSSPSVIISDSTSDNDRLRTAIFSKLKSLQTEGIMNNVQCSGPDCIKFQHALFDVKCCILLKPFMVVQTARLCQQLYFMNENVTALLNMVVYWAMQHRDFSHIGLTNPFVIYWLVYFFFQKKNVLPPIVELQKSCPIEIVDKQNNVAFVVNEKLFADVLKPQRNSKQNIRAQIEMLLEWFQFMDDTLGETNGKGENRRHSLICPRFATLIDKRKFKVCWELHRKNKKHVTSKQKKVRRLWKSDLESMGFEEPMWNRLLGLKLPDTLSVQHPLYISQNISLQFEGPFSKRFFGAIKLTRQQLSRLLSENAAETSLLHSLSDL